MPKTAMIALFACVVANGVWAQASSEKVRDNPATQYMLVKMVVGQSIGVMKARALPVEAGGYNLLKYCWTPFNVLGDWGDRSGLTGEMVVRAFETLSWARDLARAGFPEAPIAEAIGRYEAALIAANFANAARTRSLKVLTGELEGLRLRTPGSTDIVSSYRCDRQASSLGLNYATAPEDGHARFHPLRAARTLSRPAARCRRFDALRLLAGGQDRGADVVRRRDRLQRALAGRLDRDGKVQPRRAAQRRNRDAARATQEIAGRKRLAGAAPISAPAP